MKQAKSQKDFSDKIRYESTKNFESIRQMLQQGSKTSRLQRCYVPMKFPFQPSREQASDEDIVSREDDRKKRAAAMP